jgi:branched-subunit amino acid transport protein AzlD
LQLQLTRLVTLGLCVLSVFAVALLPFVLADPQDPLAQLRQMLSRLFPFGAS